MYSIWSIRSEAKGYFFSPAAMRFFRSRIGETVYEGPGGVYFITSEQFEGSDGVKAERRYTVRRFIPETGEIECATDFNQLSRPQAIRRAKVLAEKGK